MATQLKMFLFPFMSQGHMIPMVDMAKLFASRGVKITLVTTPLNSVAISKSISNSNSNIELLILNFPFEEAGLPNAYENADSLPTLDLLPKFLKATTFLQSQLEEALLKNPPHCLLSDMFFPWTNDVAAKSGIPRLIFHGTSFFSLCCYEFMRIHKPYNHVFSDTDIFLIPDLPGDIKLTTMKIPKLDSELKTFFDRIIESEMHCYGVVVNSFYELEAVYADSYVDELGKKAWPIGPLSLCNKETKESAMDEVECLQWLDSQKPNSVVYVCFGSVTKFNPAQLKEIASGLESSGKNFIWVVWKVKDDENEDWLPKGFEQRMAGKGLVVRGWAPQVLILNHPAVAGFMTHCGWNSTLEGLTAGVPMATWPIGAEQFYNEKLVIDVLKIGSGVGVQNWVAGIGDFIERRAIEKAIRRVMEGEEGEEMRNKATKFAHNAKRAVEKGGSSYTNINKLIQELKLLASLPNT